MNYTQIITALLFFSLYIYTIPCYYISTKRGNNMNNYLSVSQYAKINQKDPGNIRRLLANGRIKGEKIGNQWAIIADTPYPADKRKKDNFSNDKRKRTLINKHKQLMLSINSMIDDLKSIYGQSLSNIVLYGSYARGNENNESDVDIALILLKQPAKEQTDAMIDCVANYELECGKVLSVVDIDNGKFNKWKDTLPFYKNVNKEGISLWKMEV